jgi:hypothetical protein
MENDNSRETNYYGAEGFRQITIDYKSTSFTSRRSHDYSETEILCRNNASSADKRFDFASLGCGRTFDLLDRRNHAAPEKCSSLAACRYEMSKY